MNRTMMKSKLHKATVTGADLHYQGSIGIDQDLLEAADILPHEQVDIYNITNGERFHTYAIPLPRGSRDIILNGAAARRVKVGHKVIIVSYAEYTDAEAHEHEPTVLLMADGNEVWQETNVVEPVFVGA